VILSLDTTSEFGSLALTGRDGIVEEISVHSPDGFGHVLFAEIDRLLRTHAIAVGGIDCFAAAAGPGSFTGVRVGLTAVKGLAEATGKRVVAVSNLRALAWFGSAPLRAAMIDARRGEVYAAVYDARLEIVQAESVLKFDAWVRGLPSRDLEFIAADLTPFEGLADRSIPLVRAPRALAGAIGCIAWRAYEADLASDPANIDANYVRRSDAELFWKEP
jgi:tRNA threonylcarbamoyladenosine biosynthesis protein TsaB